MNFPIHEFVDTGRIETTDWHGPCRVWQSDEEDYIRIYYTRIPLPQLFSFPHVKRFKGTLADFESLSPHHDVVMMQLCEKPRPKRGRVK
jgi:hypothetical protein